MPKVYIETSIPSFYYEVRSELNMVARREWTREWWSSAADNYTLTTSLAVLNELSRGEFLRKDDVTRLLSGLSFLPIESAIAELVEAYIQPPVMPNDPLGDALHLAIASYTSVISF